MKTSWWNHRVIFNPDTKIYTIHEVFYLNGKPDGYTEDAIAPMGETVDELREELERMLRALKTPVLIYGKITAKEQKGCKNTKRG